MIYAAEAADRVVKVSLSGLSTTARLSRRAAERLMQLIYAALQQERKERTKKVGKLLETGQALCVFSIDRNDLAVFSREARRYALEYCMLREDRDLSEATLLLVRKDDAYTAEKILERYSIRSVPFPEQRSEAGPGKEAPEDPFARQSTPGKQRTREQRPETRRPSVRDKLTQMRQAEARSEREKLQQTRQMRQQLTQFFEGRKEREID